MCPVVLQIDSSVKVDSMAKYCQSVKSTARDWFCSFYNVDRSASPSVAVLLATGKEMSNKAASKFMAMEFAFRFPRETGKIRKSKKQQVQLSSSGNGNRATMAFKQLGFATYQDYLNSPLWKGIRARVLIRDGNKCRLCQRNAEQVHHRAYDYATMSGCCIDRLISICESCHHDIEFTKENKNTVKQTERKLLKCLPQ